MAIKAVKRLVIIPAYNEEESIVSVIDDLQKNAPEFDYIIINDGSTDNTFDICTKTFLSSAFTNPNFFL